MGQEYGHGLSGSFISEDLTRLQSRCWLKMRFYLKAQLGKDLLPKSLGWLLAIFSSWRVVWTEGIQVLSGYWLITVFNSLLWGSLQHFNLLHQRQWERESASMTEVTISYNLIMTVTYHTFVIVSSEGSGEERAASNIIHMVAGRIQLEITLYIQLTPKRGWGKGRVDYTRTWIPGYRWITRGHCKVCHSH